MLHNCSNDCSALIMSNEVIQLLLADICCNSGHSDNSSSLANLFLSTTTDLNQLNLIVGINQLMRWRLNLGVTQKGAYPRRSSNYCLLTLKFSASSSSINYPRSLVSCYSINRAVPNV